MKQLLNIAFFSFLVFLQIQATAATVDKVVTTSASMHKQIKAVVVKPDGYTSGKAFPVVYLLHGRGGNYKDWITKVPAIAQLADQFGVLIVCPDGAFNSWYLDSPVDTSLKYETYISKDLVAWIDQHYQTIASPKGRAITGLSMGGHGAMYNAFRHQDVFGAVGSMSGGVDLRPFPNNWQLAERLGPYAKFPERWDAYSVINLTYLLTPNALALIIDCGSEDFFYGVNKALHEKLLATNIPHDFISRPGGHTWEYWSNVLVIRCSTFPRSSIRNNRLQIGANTGKRDLYIQAGYSWLIFMINFFKSPCAAPRTTGVATLSKHHAIE